jgi:pyruvate formate lyase activating enzyme
MKIGGLQKSSLIDYPGMTSCVLFLSGCNFDCPYCHNPQLVRIEPNSTFLEENRVYDFLKRRKSLLDGVVISGGEPTIHPGLISMCEEIKQMGYPIKLDTNGSRPQMIRRLIERRYIDYIAMDIKTAPSGYPHFIQKDFDPETILTSIRIVMDSPIPYEFKTTCVKPIVDPGTVESISRNIQGARLYALQRSRLTRVLHPEFFEGMDPLYDDDEFLHLKSIAEKRVNRCIIR